MEIKTGSEEKKKKEKYGSISKSILCRHHKNKQLTT